MRLGTAEGSTTDLLDPAPDSSAFITMLSSIYLSQLTEVDADGNLQPQLAASFEANADATQWTFKKLRKGVEFHNGKPLMAEDVVATINHHRVESSKSSVKAFAAEVADIKADGDRTVVLSLKRGNANYPFILSTGAFSIVPSKDGKADPATGVGTGAYVLESIEPGVRAQLKRNPNYLNVDVAHFDTAEILIIADVVARNNALISDVVDLKNVHLLERTAGIDVLDVTATLHYTADEHHARTVQRQQCPHGAQACRRPRGTAAEDSPRPRRAGERSPDLAGQPVLQHRAAAAAL